MTIETVAEFYLGTEVGQEIHKRGIAKSVAASLRVRFGDHPDIPSTAAGLTLVKELDTCYCLISEASSMDDLNARLIPTQPTA
jgi:hypothetical protein